MMAEQTNQSSTLKPVKLLNYDEKSRGLTEKMHENPLFPLGIAGFSSLVGYNLYKIISNRKNKQHLPISLQLIHTRMYAQGFVLGTLSLGVMYMLGTRIYSMATHQKYENPFEIKRDN